MLDTRSILEEPQVGECSVSPVDASQAGALAAPDDDSPLPVLLGIAGAVTCVALVAKSYLDAEKRQQELNRVKSLWEAHCSSDVPTLLIVNTPTYLADRCVNIFRFLEHDMRLERRTVRLLSHCDGVRDLTMDTLIHRLKDSVLEAYERTRLPCLSCKELVLIDGAEPELFMPIDVLVRRQAGKSKTTVCYVAAWTVNGKVAEFVSNAFDGILQSSAFHNFSCSSTGSTSLSMRSNAVFHASPSLSAVQRLFGISSRTEAAAVKRHVDATGFFANCAFDGTIAEVAMRLRYNHVYRKELAAAASDRWRPRADEDERDDDVSWTVAGAAKSLWNSIEGAWSRLASGRRASSLPRTDPNRDSAASRGKIFFVVVTQDGGSTSEEIVKVPGLRAAVARFRCSLGALQLRRCQHPAACIASPSPAASVRLELHATCMSATDADNVDLKDLVPIASSDATNIARYCRSSYTRWRNAGIDVSEQHSEHAEWVVSPVSSAALEDIYGSCDGSNGHAGAVDIRRVLFEVTCA